MADYPNISFLFTHPVLHTIVTGTVVEIDGQQITFRPLRQQLLSGLEVGMRIDRCILRIGADTIRISGRVKSNTSQLVLSYLGLEGEERGLLLSYLASYSG